MTRGILSIYWGDESKLPIDRLKLSVGRFHPELPHEIIKVDVPTTRQDSLYIKSQMMDMSPFEETLFLDVDTVVMGNLNFGFTKAQQFGLAACVCEAPWARRYRNIFGGDEVEYNTGVLFFTKAASNVFEEWKSLVKVLDSSIDLVNGSERARMEANDQGPFAMAIEKTGFNPFVLPLNWNFRPMWQRSFFGPIKVWHDYADPPPVFEDLSQYYASPESIIQFHQG